METNILHNCPDIATDMDIHTRRFPMVRRYRLGRGSGLVVVVRRYWEIDPSPDLTWLQQSDSEMGAGFERTASERRDAWDHGLWDSLGAVASVAIADDKTGHTFWDSGECALWGIESDSGADFLRETMRAVVADAMAALRVEISDAIDATERLAALHSERIRDWFARSMGAQRGGARVLAVLCLAVGMVVGAVLAPMAVGADSNRHHISADRGDRVVIDISEHRSEDAALCWDYRGQRADGTTRVVIAAAPQPDRCPVHRSGRR